MGVPVKLRLPDSGYTAQLRGKAGKVTAGITLTGVYQSSWDMYFFDVLISGPYDLWVDPNGGTTYSKDSIWSGATGKGIFGQDIFDSLEP